MKSALDRLAMALSEREAVVDAVMVVLLLCCALGGFAGTFDGPLALLAGWAGVLIGVSLDTVCRSLAVPRWARIAARVLGTSLVYLAVAPFLGARSADDGPLSPDAWMRAAQVAFGGWRDLLTTLPPVAQSGPMAALPWLMGLVAGLLTFAAARTWLRSGPVLGLVGATAALTALLGTSSSSGAVLRGLVLILGAALWAGIRSSRLVASNRPVGAAQFAAGAALLMVTGVIAAPAAQAMTSSGGPRETLRERMMPPVTDHTKASVLAGFRRFRPVGEALADKALVQVSGLPKDAPVRFAVLDCFTGTVWDACGLPGVARPGAGAFWKVGTAIPAQIEGKTAEYRIRVEDAYAQDPYLRDWVPSAGSLTSLDYAGDRREALSEASRVNVSTGAVLVSGGVRGGEETVQAARLPGAALPDTLPATQGALTDVSRLQAVSSYVARWGGPSSDPWQRLRAAAQHLRSTGAYSDGDTGSERPVLPGHGVGRIEALLGATEPAGDDEQYASAAALMANSLGLPARVVVGGVPDSSGVLRGREVRAWIEVAVENAWVQLGPDQIVPPRDKKPKPIPEEDVQGASAAVVPPPNTARRPSSEDPFASDTSLGGHDRRSTPVSEWWVTMPLWARLTGAIVLGPPLLWLAFVGAVMAVKGGRRSARQKRAPTAAVCAGWDEVVDRLIDRGMSPPSGVSRRELARLSGDPSLLGLASRIDAVHYGPQSVGEEEVAAVWREVMEQHRLLAANLPWWRRLLVAGSLRSLLPGWRTREGAEGLRPSSVYFVQIQN
ncbi:transglutaminase-like domain-containing protein [Austwickia chelonae]|uniref:transglutaminase-like domain-containing protein n=1 Tax=Austwickia chelonae TaxID=100225 RepID=UPI000E26D3DA|nr:transglutaminase-like domain-containing protein [Austwickia chelonae]